MAVKKNDGLGLALGHLSHCRVRAGLIREALLSLELDSLPSPSLDS